MLRVVLSHDSHLGFPSQGPPSLQFQAEQGMNSAVQQDEHLNCDNGFRYLVADIHRSSNKILSSSFGIGNLSTIRNPNHLFLIQEWQCMHLDYELYCWELHYDKTSLTYQINDKAYLWCRAAKEPSRDPPPAKWCKSHQFSKTFATCDLHLPV